MSESQNTQYKFDKLREEDIPHSQRLFLFSLAINRTTRNKTQ